MGVKATTTQTISLMVACNDHRNGVFAGEADLIELGTRHSDDVHIALDGPTTRFREFADAVKIGRRKFPVLGGKEWVGNWCWNEYFVTPEVAAKVLNHLRTIGWSRNEWTEEFGDKWESGDPFTASDFNGKEE